MYGKIWLKKLVVNWRGLGDEEELIEKMKIVKIIVNLLVIVKVLKVKILEKGVGDILFGLICKYFFFGW